MPSACNDWLAVFLLRRKGFMTNFDKLEDNITLCHGIIAEAIKKAHSRIDNSAADNIPDHAIPLVYAMLEAIRDLKPYNDTENSWDDFITEAFNEICFMTESKKIAKTLLENL